MPPPDLVEGQGQGGGLSILALETKKKRNFWTKVVTIVAIRTLLSSRVREMVQEDREKRKLQCIAAANMIGLCYMTCFLRRMGRRMAVFRRDHAHTRRPFRLLVSSVCCSCPLSAPVSSLLMA